MILMLLMLEQISLRGLCSWNETGQYRFVSPKSLLKCFEASQMRARACPRPPRYLHIRSLGTRMAYRGISASLMYAYPALESWGLYFSVYVSVTSFSSSVFFCVLGLRLLFEIFGIDMNVSLA
jgi:hypothetical protein